ncbi:MAG: ATP-binding cassette domain-containing protein, partial [Butyricicoccus sp.]
LGAFAIIAYYDPTMAVLALLGVPVSVVVSRVLVRRMRTYNREMKSSYSDLLSFQEDSFQNITSIKAFGITGQFHKKMDGLLNNYRASYLRYNQLSVRTTALMSLMGVVVWVSCFGWGVYRLWTGAISYGSMTMFLQLASSLGAAFSALIGLAPTAISISTSAGRMMAVVELPAEDAKPDKDFVREGAYAIDLRGVTFRYPSSEPVLRGVDVTAQPGDLVALTGPSGEGKTTLLRILLGLARPSAGNAILIGASGRQYPVSAATRSAVGYVPQGNSIFAGTIAENLRLTKPDATNAELEAVLKAACAYDFVKELPGGMQYIVGGRGKGLSEGQAQRIAVARALLRRAPILLLDEATSALDEDTEERMLNNLMEGGWVRTCILVTHRPGSRKYCTRRYCVQDGRIEVCQ